MKKYLSVFFAFILTICITFGLSSCFGDGKNKNIVIVYTTDVHCSIEGYASLAEYVKDVKASNKNITLIDAGDAMQGGLIGSLSKGEYVIEMMNELNYDIYVVGNHEFDYGIDELAERIDEFNGDFVSCNISYTGHNENKLSEIKPYSIIDYGVAKVGYVGVTTPSALVASNPSTFKEDGEVVYSFAEGNLFEEVQSNIDECYEQGCKYVVLVAHLGYSENYAPYSSKDLIANTSGAIAVIDGHSHQLLPCSYYANKDGEMVPLCTGGYKMSAFGRITISSKGDVDLSIVSSYTKKNSEILNKLQEIQDRIDEQTSTVVATADLSLSIYDEDGVRIVRNREAGLGDLVADAFKSVTNADIAFINGGGLRDDIQSGDLTYGDIKNVLPFDNEVCIVKATGQKILDYLEFVSRNTQSVYSDGTMAVGENGGFAQVSGLKYTIDTSVESTVETSDSGEFERITGERRIKNVSVLVNGEYVAIELDKEYTVASLNFILLDGGDGANMFMDCEVVSSYVMLDSEALTTYLVDTLHGHIKDLYETTGNRITIE